MGQGHSLRFPDRNPDPIRKTDPEKGQQILKIAYTRRLQKCPPVMVGGERVRRPDLNRRMMVSKHDGIETIFNRSIMVSKHDGIEKDGIEADGIEAKLNRSMMVSKHDGTENDGNEA